MLTNIKKNLRPIRAIWRNLVMRLKEDFFLMSLTLRGYHRFKFIYFNEWYMVRLRRYLDWQLPVKRLRIQLTKYSVDEFVSIKPFIEEHLALAGRDEKLTVVDFSCGIGRSTAFIKNMFSLDKAKFVLIDGNRKVYGPKTSMNTSQSNFHRDVIPVFDSASSFYNDFELTDCFLESNGVSNFSLIDLAEPAPLQRLSRLREVDIFYSFHAVGYHWEISAVFDYYELDTIFKSGALLIFGLRVSSDSHGFGDTQVALLDEFLKRGFEKVALVEGSLLQRFLIVRKI